MCVNRELKLYIQFLATGMHRRLRSCRRFRRHNRVATTLYGQVPTHTHNDKSASAERLFNIVKWMGGSTFVVDVRLVK